MTLPFKVQVQEIYCAPQGEGPNLGRPSLFLRVHGCPLSCAWCDTSFTWDKNHPDYGNFTEYTSRDELVADMLSLAEEEAVFPRGLVITGGEPMLYQKLLPRIISAYKMESPRGSVPHYRGVEIETAGTIVPIQSLLDRGGIHFNISHKLTSSGNARVPPEKLWNADATRAVAFATSATAIFKPVVGEGDVATLSKYLTWLTGILGHTALSKVYLMPEGQTQDEVLYYLPLVMELAQSYGTNYTVRAHILAFNKERRR